MMFAHEAYRILGFSEEETYNIYRLTAVVMHMGNMTKDFVPVGKEEQAEIKDDTNAQKVASLCGIDCEWMINYFCKPKLKVSHVQELLPQSVVSDVKFTSWYSDLLPKNV